MAGDWLKMECSTPDKPEVLSLTVKMGWEDPDLTVGKLFRLWRWFDQQTLDGNAHGVTPALLDRQVGAAGFVNAVAEVGWLTITPDGISLSKFDRHNGQTAKDRALTAKRVAKHKSNATGNDDGNADDVTPPLPREEKKREEKRVPKGTTTPQPAGVSDAVWSDFVAHRRHHKALITQTALDGIAREASKAGWTLQDALAECCARDWRGFKADWVTKGSFTRGAQPNRQEALEERNRAIGQEWAAANMPPESAYETQ